MNSPSPLATDRCFNRCPGGGIGIEGLAAGEAGSKASTSIIAGSEVLPGSGGREGLGEVVKAAGVGEPVIGIAD